MSADSVAVANQIETTEPENVWKQVANTGPVASKQCRASAWDSANVKTWADVHLSESEVLINPKTSYTWHNVQYITYISIMKYYASVPCRTNNISAAWHVIVYTYY